MAAEVAAKSVIGKVSTSLVRGQAWIGGAWVNALGDKIFPVHDPGTGEKIMAVPDMGAEDAKKAVLEAHKGQKVWGSALAWVSI